MPLYEYECDACGERFEAIRKFSDPPLEVCARCGKGPIRRLVSSPAFQFKGSGWYITDYAKKGKSGGDTSSGKSESSKTDSAKADSPASTDKASTSTGETAKPATPAKSSTTKD